jgi:hypothetical protein
MALIRQILSGSPDRVFLSVKNASATTMTIGRGVVFDYYNSTQQDGYNVTWRTTTHHLGLLAGVVVHHGIQPGGYGLVQCFGHVDTIHVAYTAQAGSTSPISGFVAATLTTIFLSAQTEATVLGAFEPLAHNYTSGISAVAAHFHLANAAVYMGTTLGQGDTTNTQDSERTYVSVKGFIRAM